MDVEGSRRRRMQEAAPVEEQPEASVPWWEGAWAVSQIVIGAVLYLFHFASTLSTLNTYYYYNYRCPQKRATDPVCFRLATNNDNYNSAFIICLALMATAHLSNSLIFYVTLDPALHPLRLAYFLPLIYFFRLIRLFWRSFNRKSLKDFYDSQQEPSNLFNILGASLDSIPQFILQFNIAIELLNYSASPQGVVPIPKVLVVNLIGSLVSAIYTGFSTIFSLVSNSAFTHRVCIAIMAGVQTLAIVVTKAAMVAALTIPYHAGLWITPYAFFSMVFPWIFYLVLLQMHNISDGDKVWSKLAKSIALAHVSVFVGPMYVIVRYFGSSPRLYSFLILGTLVQIIVEVLGIVEMVLIAKHLVISGTPCRPKAWKSRNDNKFLTCHSVLGIVCTAIPSIMLTSVIFIIIHQRDQRVHNKVLSSNACEISNELDQGQHRASNLGESTM